MTGFSGSGLFLKVRQGASVPGSAASGRDSPSPIPGSISSLELYKYRLYFESGRYVGEFGLFSGKTGIRHLPPVRLDGMAGNLLRFLFDFSGVCTAFIEGKLRLAVRASPIVLVLYYLCRRIDGASAVQAGLAA